MSVVTREMVERFVKGNDKFKKICPRCGGQMPVGYPGAISRYADVEVCSSCGTDEALRGFAGVPNSFDDWKLGRV